MSLSGRGVPFARLAEEPEFVDVAVVGGPRSQGGDPFVARVPLWWSRSGIVK
jgi:hypothetical protein